MAQPPNPLFESYLHHAAAAAEIARDALMGSLPLQDKIAQLESELKLYKLGMTEAQAAARAAQKQLDAGDQIVYCVLDGDGCIFNRALVQKGRDGGREAAVLLSKKIGEFAEGQGVDGQITVVINVFLNKYGLGKLFNSCGIADDTTFSNFLQGLNSAHSLIHVVDVGAQKEAADAKISQGIKLYSKLPSCKLVLAGAAHDGGYAHLFSALETEAPAQFAKVHLLKSYTESAFEIKRLNLKTVMFEGIFEPKKLVSYASALPPQTPRKNSPALNGSGAATPLAGGGEYGSKTPRTARKAAAAAFRAEELNKENLVDGTVRKTVKLVPIDPTKSLSKQNPPCCNQHYLNPPCLHGDSCKYSHNYLLSAKQLMTLKQDAKKSPCVNAIHGKPCKPGCFAGHVCPRGTDCRYGASCRFSLPGMHPPGTKGRTDGAAWRGAAGPQLVAGASDSSGGAYSESDVDSGFETTSSVD
ncbi:hypothetical protein JCM10207_002410 [Rhodosporidiobolus poonsookiae]